jgi:BASS family bile acid:Na+ symporter
MQQSVLTAVFLPVALGVVMLGLGLSLTVADFKRVAQVPKAVLIGLTAQMLGIHNGTLAIAIASAPTLLNNSVMAIPAAVYSVIMFFTAAAFGAFVTRSQQAAALASA